MKVCFIWHMHQPYYKDLQAGEYVLPWVRLHGVKDYLDMVKILDNHPRIKQCFNLVPSLLEQIEDYVENNAEDRHLYLSRKKPEELTDEEKLEISNDFFFAHYPTMVQPYPRYDELFVKCSKQDLGERLRSLTDQDILDIQVWFNATWIDPTLRGDSRVKDIYRKKTSFTEAQKQQLLDYQIEILRQIVPAYRERQNSNQIEVSFSPYFHPILPLLYDNQSARVSQPNLTLPKRGFSHPEDVEYHVKTSADLYKSLFGSDRFGMWPSEGSVSEEILPILKRYGVEWIATDEEVYFASVNHPEARKRGMKPSVKDGFHKPYLVGDPDESIGILFRDHQLSDKLGFVYSGWDPEEAADDFIDNLHKLEQTIGRKKSSNNLVSIILDGENAWEYYQNDGNDFLNALYDRIEVDSKIETVLPREVFSHKEKIEHLPYLFSGSWINHNFRVWIGHDEDNRAWDLLSVTRDKLEEFLKQNPEFDKSKTELAWKEIYIAEGSDWCWWYGDEHHTTQFELFDRLFRKHLQNVWDVIGVPPPMELMQPIRQLKRQIGFTQPTDLLSVKIDGKQTNFFEWYGAGSLNCYKLGSAMHRAEHKIHQLLYGYDNDNLYLRIDFSNMAEIRESDYLVKIELSTGYRYLVSVSSTEANLKQLHKSQYKPVDLPISCAWHNLLEIAIPRAGLEFTGERVINFSVALCQQEKEIEKWPDVNYIYFELPKVGETLFWQV